MLKLIVRNYNTDTILKMLDKAYSGANTKQMTLVYKDMLKKNPKITDQQVLKNMYDNEVYKNNKNKYDTSILRWLSK